MSARHSLSVSTLSAVLLMSAGSLVTAQLPQTQPPTQLPTGPLQPTGPQSPLGQAGRPPLQPGQNGSEPFSGVSGPATPGGTGVLSADAVHVDAADVLTDGSRIFARHVSIGYAEYQLTGDTLTGDMERELILSGGATLTFRNQVLSGDTIRFNPHTRAFRIENLHTALTPDFLQNRVTGPLYLSSGSIYGAPKQPITGKDIIATTCERPRPHYYIQGAELDVLPGKRVTIKRAAFYLWGHRWITLPTLNIPLDVRPHRSGYTPDVGRSVDEGFFVKSALNYLLADRAPGLLRLDLMQKKGIGIGVDQAWNLAKTAGLLALYAIPTGGAAKNLSGRFNDRINLGGGESLQLSTDFQRNSYLALPNTTSVTSTVGFNRQAGLSGTTVNINQSLTDSNGSSNRSLAATISQQMQIAKATNFTFNADYSSNSTKAPSFSQQTEQLNTRLQASRQASNYTLELVANKTIPIGKGGQQAFGGVQRLPELALTNFRFTRGWLAKSPLILALTAGSYAESGGGFGTASAAKTVGDRLVLAADVQNSHIGLTHSTDLNISAGFEQYLYTDSRGFAQYNIRNNTSLLQHIGHRSGVTFTYSYQRSEGATPFRFDQLGQFHSIAADIGQMDDQHFQLTARVGYDLSHSTFPGQPARPWQSVSANLLYRPVNWAASRTLFSFDPNTGKFVDVSSDLRFSGHNEFSFDLISQYDPNRHRFGSMNSYFNLPVSRAWRIVGILQYNGYLNRFESQDFQIIRDMHCIDAVVTFTNNPFGFRKDKQILFQLRIKAIPLLNQFGTGQFGQALDSGVGQVY